MTVTSDTSWRARLGKLSVDDVALFVVPIFIPLQQTARLAGRSVAFGVFALVALFAAVARGDAIGRVARSRYARPLCLLVVASAVIEAVHPPASYEPAIRIGQMAVGVVVVAALCRSRRSLNALLLGQVAAGVMVTGFVAVAFVHMHGGASGFSAGTAFRDQLARRVALHENIDTLGFACTQGALIAFALALFAPSVRWRLCTAVAAVVCATGELLTLSRGGFVILFIGAIAIVLMAGRRHWKTFLIAGVIAAALLLMVPRSVMSRFSVPSSYPGGGPEARTVIYRADARALKDYWLAGVGAGRFESGWGARHGFVVRGEVKGAHNAYVQVTLFWGLAGFGALLLVCGTALRSVWLRRGPLALALRALVLSLVMFLLFYSDVFIKPSVLAFGAALGVAVWHSQRPAPATVAPSGAAQEGDHIGDPR